MTALAAPMASALRSPATSFAEPIETTVTSPPPRLVDQLQGHLDAVRVGFIEDELARAVQIVRRVERLRGGRVGYLFDADNDIHGT